MLLDLNVATVAELLTLPDIEETIARRIVARRTELGHFTAVGDLLSIDGITDSSPSGIASLRAAEPAIETDRRNQS
jgi:competence protein ComEA